MRGKGKLVQMESVKRGFRDVVPLVLGKGEVLRERSEP